MKQVALGIDVGGTNSGFGLIDRQGEVLASRSIRTQAFVGADAFFEGICAEIDDTISSFEGELILSGIGIGAPNGNYYTGTVDRAPNLNWEGKVPLTEMFQARYAVPAVLTNDANAAAIGEMLFGGASGMHDFILTTIGTGLGSGLVVNGKLVHGFSGFAGELGHTTVIPQGRLCSCGREGCLEAYVSARGMIQTALELLAQSPDSSTLKYIAPDALTPAVLAQAAEAGDSVARQTFERTGQILGEKLADLVAVLSPQALFISGGIASAGELLLAPTRKAMNETMLNVFDNQVELLNSKLIGKQPAIRGAAAMIWQQIQDEENVPTPPKEIVWIPRDRR